MRLQKLVYQAASGWGGPLPSAMYGAGTQVLALAARKLPHRAETVIAPGEAA